MKATVLLGSSLIALATLGTSDTLCGQDSSGRFSNSTITVKCAGGLQEARTAAIDANEETLHDALIAAGAACAVECGDAPNEYACDEEFDPVSNAVLVNSWYDGFWECWAWQFDVMSTGHISCDPCPAQDPIPVPD